MFYASETVRFNYLISITRPTAKYSVTWPVVISECKYRLHKCGCAIEKETKQPLILMYKFRKLFLTSQLTMNESLIPGDYINDEMDGG
jgi:hypothetical protein